MNNQTSNFGAQPTLQPIILPNACNPNSRGNVSTVATKCLGKINSDALVWFYNKLHFSTYKVLGLQKSIGMFTFWQKKYHQIASIKITVVQQHFTSGLFIFLSKVYYKLSITTLFER